MLSCQKSDQFGCWVVSQGDVQLAAADTELLAWQRAGDKLDARVQELLLEVVSLRAHVSCLEESLMFGTCSEEKAQ